MRCTTFSPGMSSAVTTTTRSQSNSGSRVMERIRPLGMVDLTVWPYQASATTRSSVYSAAPVTLAAPSRLGTDRPIVEVVTIVGNKNARRPEAQHLPKHHDTKMPTLSLGTPPAAAAAENGSSPGISVRAPVTPAYAQILTTPALEFVAGLARAFEPRRRLLLGRRADRQRDFDAGAFPTFLASTADIREAEWRVAPIPRDLLDRRVEITGPVDRKMVINALNSGAQVYMADFEDSHAPTWRGTIEGQINLRDAVAGSIEFKSGEKQYALNPTVATLMVRPRGWHLVERHVTVDGESISASLFDFGLFFFHNAKALLARGSGPYFYLPKLESHLEARLWNDVFVAAQDALGIPRGTIRATVLIETLPAAFEMDEILYELREHMSGLNAGRWDYLFSLIKTLRSRKGLWLPDRAQLTMTVPFMRAYSELLVATCHRRGAHAMGGMAAFIPSRKDPEVNELALAKVREDKERETDDGFDGTWVAHPDLVPVATEVFDSVLGERPNQVERLRDDVEVSAADLL